jgi:hypothetical protein
MAEKTEKAKNGRYKDRGGENAAEIMWKNPFRQAKDLLVGRDATRKKAGQRFFRVRARRRRTSHGMFHSFGEHEKRRHRHKGHVAMPNVPFTPLKAGDTAFAFGVLESGHRPRFYVRVFFSSRCGDKNGHMEFPKKRRAIHPFFSWA